MKFSLKYIFAALFLAISWSVGAQTTADSTAINNRIADTIPAGSTPVETITADTLSSDSIPARPAAADSIRTDSIPTDSIRTDSVRPPVKKAFLERQLDIKASDSLVYDVRERNVYLYHGGDVIYGDMNLLADRIKMNVDTKDIEAEGAPMADSAGKMSRPKFIQGGQAYEMKSLRFNLNSKRGVIYNSTTQQGEGYMIAGKAKIHEDKTTDAEAGQYTTCNHLDHPHFYIAMNKARVIPGKKAIFGMAHFVLEDVPLYFPFLPFGFFPLASGPSSGFIMPSFGEEYSKGFFLRGGGYYFRLSDYMDAQLTGSIYTLGSWDARVATRYIKRYKYSGNLSFDYSKNVIGEKGSADYISSPTYSLRWTHRQDAKFRPGTTFAASVNFTSSGYSRYSAQSLNDMLSTQTNSSISYSKSWRPAAEGRFPGANLSLSFNHSQNSRDSSIMFTFPNASWSIPKFKPFKRVEGTGKERWYEKLSLNYSGRMQGSVTTKEKYLFKEQMFEGFKTGVSHSVPISVAWSLFNDFVNLTPNATYNENWYFKRVDKRWDDSSQTVVSDTTRGFYRAWDYSLSASTGTKIYGMFAMKKTNGWLRAVRHVITPTASFTFRPDFSTKYRKTYQTNAEGATATYSPFEGQVYGVPGGNKQAAISFSLGQNLEAKIRDGDTVRVIKIVDVLNISSSYNFVQPEFKLSNFRVNFSTPIYKQYSLKFDAEFDPYKLDKDGKRINYLLMRDGKLPRLIRIGTSFGWQLNNTFGSGQPINDTGAAPRLPTQEELDMMEPYQRAEAERQLQQQLGGTYYDFSMPYNLSINYSLGYSKNGRTKHINQTLGFGGSLTLTPYQSDGNYRWGINFQGGYDFEMRKPTLGSIAIVRDLHCFVMSLNWIPIGSQRSWAFNIRVKASVLQDIKYDKRRSMFDNRFD